MRIALTHPYSWPEVRRGAERIIVELSTAMAARGHDVTVFTAGNAAEPTDGSEVTVVRLRRRFRSDLRHERDFALRLLPRLARGRFDVIHSLMVRDAVSAIQTARITGHRTVFTNLGNPVRAWWENRPDGPAHRQVVNRVDVYGCMSQYSLDALASEYGRTGALMPGGVDLTTFRPHTREQRPTVLFSGAVHEARKGLGVLLDAVSELAAEVPDIRVWISGPGDAGPVLAAAPSAARRAAEVLSLGEPGGQGERYGRAWVTALPSKGDSFGMVLLESLACGTPIVASTHAALPELVDQGRTGALCDPDDSSSVAAAVRLALALASQAETVDACRQAATPFDWQTGIAPRFEALYAGSANGA